MLGKLARRLGFQQSVPVGLIDGWHLPTARLTPLELGPRGGTAACRVDEFGRVQIVDAGWLLEFTLAAGARWVPMSDGERVTQTVVAPAIVETTVKTPSGPVVQRIAAGVVDGEPVAIIEIENTAGVAIAVGAVARPLRLDGRGYIGACRVEETGLRVDGRRVVRFESAPASVACAAGAEGDLLQQLPEPTDGTRAAEVTCRSGAAQAAAVWPLPHTATLRMVVELGEVTSAGASVPGTDDINRGWATHLDQGMRIDVDGLPVAEHLRVAARSALTLWPAVPDTPSAITAMSELGFGRDVGRLLDLLDRCDDDAAVLRSLARWAQLGEQADQLDDLERILGRLARAAHEIDSRGGDLAGAGWLADALVALGGRLHQIDQPDVAERIQGFEVAGRLVEGAADRLAETTNELDRRGAWSSEPMRSAATYVRSLRAVIGQDFGDDLLVLLADLPVSWRGRAVDVFDLPIANGTVSYGLRWHGPRPALLWEANLVPEVSLTVRVPGIDPDFVSTDRQGEVLLADPGWAAS